VVDPAEYSSRIFHASRGLLSKKSQATRSPLCDGNLCALVHCVFAVCSGGGCNGRQQDDGVFLDAAQESSRDYFLRGRMPGSGRLPFESCSVVTHDVVDADGVRYHWRPLLVDFCLVGDRKTVEKEGGTPLKLIG
jgi:hypothetical protein